jgi:hypothetical protein
MTKQLPRGSIPVWIRNLLAEMPTKCREAVFNWAQLLVDPINTAPTCLVADTTVPAFCYTGFGRVSINPSTAGYAVIVMNFSTINTGNTLSPAVCFQPTTNISTLTGGATTYISFGNTGTLTSFLGNSQVRPLAAAMRVTGSTGTPLQIVSGLMPGACNGAVIGASSYNALISNSFLQSTYQGSSQAFSTTVCWKPQDIAELEMSGTLGIAGGTALSTAVPIVMLAGFTGGQITAEIWQHFEFCPGPLDSQLLASTNAGPMASLASMWSAASGLISGRWRAALTEVAGVAVNAMQFAAQPTPGRALLTVMS